MFHQMKGLASDVDDLLTYISTVLLHSEISCFLLMDMGFGLDHGPQCLPCRMMKVLSWTSICTKVFRKINNILPRISLRAEEKLGVNVPVITKPCCSWHWWATSCPATLLLVWIGCLLPSHLASSMDKWNLVQMYQLWPSHLTTGVGGLLLLQQPCCWCRQVSRTGIFHVLFALFFLTLTNTILQTRSNHPHHTRSNPFRLLTQFTDKQKTRVLNPWHSRHNV